MSYYLVTSFIKFEKFLFVNLFIFGAFVPAALPAPKFETAAPHAYLMDHTTGTVLFEKNSRVPVPPASLSKLMTSYMVFDALRIGVITLDDLLTVSENFGITLNKASENMLPTNNGSRIDAIKDPPQALPDMFL